MTPALDARLGALAARWVAFVARRSLAVLGVSVALTVLLAGLAASRLELNTDENDLFSEDLPFYDLRAEYYRVLPSLADPMVVAVEGGSRARMLRVADRLATRLEARPDLFARVHRPGGGSFFERHGLLYLELPELESRVDELFQMQPWLAALSEDPSLRGLFDTLATAVREAHRGGVDMAELTRVVDEVADVAGAAPGGPPRNLAWGDVLAGDDSLPLPSREILVLEPIVDFGRLQPAEAPLRGLREAIAGLELEHDPGVRVRVTGVHVLAAEETEHASTQAQRAGLASFLLVALILTLGLGSVRLVAASLVTLVVGLVWTAGLAALLVGHLNLISVAFAVLFIGLSIDFAIHLCVRYREAAASGAPPEAALVAAARQVGSSLVLCATTTAVGFYAFVPTAFVGVAELGLIAGTGMLVSLATNLSLLPALLARSAAPRPEATRTGGALARWLALPVRHARAVLAATGIACVAAATVAPGAHFDASPLRVRDPSTESVALLRDMLADGEAMLWNMNALADDEEQAVRLAARLEQLPSVARTLTLLDFVPKRQEEKQVLLADAAWWILPTLAETPREAPTPAERAAAARALAQALSRAADGPSSRALTRSTRRLASALEPLLASPDADARLALLEQRLISDLPHELAVLRRALEPDPVTLETLPPGIVERLRASDGRLRVEIEPVEDLEDMDRLAEYVHDVQSVAPDAFGEALMILETGRTVVRAFLQALTLAALVILALLWLLWRSWRDTALVAIAFAVATLFTVAAAVLLGVPFNFANVIVIPLLLGLGVDTGIHLVQRARAEAPADGNLLATSTSRAVLLSALTTLASFGTLGFSSHGGMASLGRLLALGLTMIVVVNLVLLPALAAAWAVRSRGGD